MFLLKSIPQVDKFIKNEKFASLPLTLLVQITAEVLQDLRERILKNEIESFSEDELVKKVLQKYKDITKPSLQKIINATGVIVHTNLGRSLIDANAFERVKGIVTSYNNLEYDLEKGKRGERYSHISDAICRLLGCEDVLIVNNNASAVFLILNTFAKQKEVVVSRGELVEIGGSFRVPDVMKQSGAKLVEVGATNKTHLYDYENAISKKTSMLMKVHKSNYSIEGFSSEVEFKELVKLAREKNLIDYYDMGSGHLVNLPYGLDQHEPSVLKYMQENPSLLSFSGDKLLGSVQAGIIVGKKEYIAKLKKNQLLRMLRVDKLTLALLEDSVISVLLNKLDEIPTLKMLFASTCELKENALVLQDAIKDICDCEVLETKTVIGGGTTPNKMIPSIALAIKIDNYKQNKMEKLFRAKNIIGRIENDRFLLDFRTIRKSEIQEIAHVVKEIANV
ncbi:L-seryl-tRNA(Sec) selenium transferase [Sulfurimonas denitrificans DSM 1251]|uniref:L-seryl-tRNA(Sec) selenium transferase n=1 Tax=Sulfurimonas denitrificans (strain ATCC 33889 / DSM 1251) TaxID=326298 RepID=SELA_SULDN|nr:L-seryl-tRNA(Sec) selenium transferase [Sulfurimonas denitrificans]Q30SC1.1 RecName: Full=L-seryl-tRNA(Sec) selenium transferase; AltName: Full=Selenocysteine synthase; Short=Sec synthase; AltName: Full=Selenocysteinyl-tRNA(Sec) synthase [Sulfurimonas denitrificans DSM 1251]ABB44110.1 L-seryl-tRNA(Sec) selenium transferase [Sulfurimonas denitrificans DSM 1251]